MTKLKDLTDFDNIQATTEENHLAFVEASRKLLDINGFPYGSKTTYLYLQRKVNRVAFHRKQWLKRGKDIGLTLTDFKKWLKQNKWKWDGATSNYIFPLYIVRVKELIQHSKKMEDSAELNYSDLTMKEADYKAFGYFEPKGL